MALFNVRLDDQLAIRFDAWADGRGGRSSALRQVIRGACEQTSPPAGRRAPAPLRSTKLTVRLSAKDARGLAAAAAAMELTPNAWVAALVRARLHARPTFRQAETVAVIAMQAELRRIGVNVNQIARALNVAVMEGKVLDLELAYLEDLRTELQVHMSALREAFEGNLAYWLAAP